MMLDTSDDVVTSMKMPKVGNLPSPTTALTMLKAKAAMLELNFILKDMLWESLLSIQVLIAVFECRRVADEVA